MLGWIKKLGKGEAPQADRSKLTIVLPSKGRADDLHRLLSYFQAEGLPYALHVLLTGDAKRFKAENYPGLTVTFKHFGDDISFHTKLRTGLAEVTTPLVAMCTDDDVVIPSALMECERFLTNHPDYSACQGYHALYAMEKKAVALYSVAFFTPSLDEADPLQRFYSLIRRYQPICWAVFRTEVMQKIAALFEEGNLYFFEELVWSGTAALMGKVKRLPLIYCLRRIDDIHLQGHPLFALLESPQRFFREYLRYTAKMKALLQGNTRLDDTQLQRAVDLMHACYFARETVPNTVNYFTDQVMGNPAASIHDQQINNVLRHPRLDLSKGWEKEINDGGITYRIFPNFANPQPREEIILPKSFLQDTIAASRNYFEA